MSDLDLADLERLKALAEKATPGPWNYLASENWIMAGHADGGVGIFEIQPRARFAGVEIRNTNAEFVSACDPQTIIALIDEVLAARRKSDGQ